MMTVSDKTRVKPVVARTVRPRYMFTVHTARDRDLFLGTSTMMTVSDKTRVMVAFTPEINYVKVSPATVTRS